MAFLLSFKLSLEEESESEWVEKKSRWPGERKEEINSNESHERESLSRFIRIQYMYVYFSSYFTSRRGFMST